MEDKIYVVTIYRWSDVKDYSYVICAGFDKLQMIDIAEKEEALRGGKYGAEVVEFMQGNPNSKKTIRKMRTFKQILGIKEVKNEMD